nr:transposase family protein [Streptomyces aidingensis]
MPDLRDRRGIRYPWTALLTAAAAAVLVGAVSITAIGEWVADAPQRVLALLGFCPVLPPAFGREVPDRCGDHCRCPAHPARPRVPPAQSGAHHLAVVKKNHPGLHERVRRLPWRDIRLDHHEPPGPTTPRRSAG